MEQKNRINANGLVLREFEIGENDKLITVLTDTSGKLTISGKGLKSLKSKHLAATQQFSYSAFSLRRKGDYCYIEDSLLIDAFFGLRTDIVKLSLASYICAVTESATLDDMPDVPMLRLTLNTLYAINKDIAPLPAIKAAYELKAVTELGFEPDLSGCAVCGKKTGDDLILNVMMGGLVCRSCKAKADAADEHPEAEVDREGVRRINIPLDFNVLEAMRYIITAPVDKILKFSLDAPLIPALSNTAETYMLNHLENEYPSLKYYKSML